MSQEDRTRLEEFRASIIARKDTQLIADMLWLS
jgi:hypothetical protein